MRSGLRRFHSPDRLRAIDWLSLAAFAPPIISATVHREDFDMAIHAHDFGKASALPLAAMLAIIPRLPRPLLARLAARLIERLNEIDGDPDLEDMATPRTMAMPRTIDADTLTALGHAPSPVR
jgi:hypothetical protein